MLKVLLLIFIFSHTMEEEVDGQRGNERTPRSHSEKSSVLEGWGRSDSVSVCGEAFSAT